MAPPTTEAELPREILTEVLLRVSTPANLVRAAATSKSWRAAAVADPGFLARYRKRQPSSPFLGIYVPGQFAGDPLFHMPKSIRLGKDDVRDLRDAASRAFYFGDIRRYQDQRRHVDGDTFIAERLELHPDCRVLDCHNSRLLLTRGDEALEVRSPLTRESIVIPFPPDVVHPECLQACLLHGHDKADVASFRVVCLQHHRPPRSRWQARAVEYDSTRKSWQVHGWKTITDIEGTPEKVMHAGHRIFCKYKGLTQAALVLDTNNMKFSTLPLPSHQNFAIGEIEDNVCCFVETHGCVDHRLKVWLLDGEGEKLHWDLKKHIKMKQVFGEHLRFYNPRAISNGIVLLCSSTTDRHFVVDLKTFSMKEQFEFHGQCAYPMQMPWPPIFSANAVGGFDRDREPASVGTQSCGLSKEKKRERGEQEIDPAKRDQDHLHVDDSEQLKKVEKLVHLMQLDQTAQRVDLAGQVMLADVIAATESPDCLGRSVQSRGLSMLDSWLQEAHKGKSGGSSSKEADKPINVSTVQSCSTGKSVNHLRSHKNLEIKRTAVSEEGDNSPYAMLDEDNSRPPDDSVKDAHASRVVCSASSYMNEKGVRSSETKVGNSFSPMNPLIEIKYSEASHSLHAGDDTSVDLLASVAGKLSKSELVSPSASPRNSSAKKLGCKGDNAGKVTVESNVGPSQDTGPVDAKEVVGGKEVKSDSCLAAKEEQRQTVPSPKLADLKAVGSSVKTKIHQGRANKCNSQPDSVDSKGENQDECRHQGRKRAGSKPSKKSLKAMDPRTCNWKSKRYLIKPISQRKRHLFSIASKISDEVQIATSNCREASAASTVAVSTGDCKLLLGGSDSTYKSTDAGKQSIIDVSITSAPSLSDPSVGESAGKRGEAGQDSNEPQYLDIQDPTATHTSAAAQQCFGKDKNYVPNDYLISDKVQIATSSCREASAASTVAVSTGDCKLLLGGSDSTFKSTDAGKQSIIDVSITSAPSLSDPSVGESAGQRGEAAQDSNEPQYLDIQDPTATHTSAAAQQCFGKDKNYVPNDYLISEICDEFSDLINPKGAAAVEPEEPLVWRSQRPFCVQNLDNDLLLQAPALASCPLQGRKRADSRESKSPEAKGPGRNNWKQKPKFLEALFASRKVFKKQEIALRKQKPKFLEPKFSDLVNTKAAATAALQEEMKALVASISNGAGAAFTAMQLQELGHQSQVYQYMVARVPVPTHLVFPVWKSVTGASSEGAQKYPTLMGLATLCLDFGKNTEPEPGRCRRTDGKKWRCRKSTIPNEKYCERHMHRGRKHPVQVVVKDDKPDSASGSKYVEANFASRSSIASKRSDEVETATSSCREASATSTAAVDSTIKFTGSGKQRIIDVSITSAPNPSPEARENNQSLLVEQRGEAARGKGSPEATGPAKRRKKLNSKYIDDDWVV